MFNSLAFILLCRKKSKKKKKRQRGLSIRARNWSAQSSLFLIESQGSAHGKLPSFSAKCCASFSLSFFFCQVKKKKEEPYQRDTRQNFRRFVVWWHPFFLFFFSLSTLVYSIISFSLYPSHLHVFRYINRIFISHDLTSIFFGRSTFFQRAVCSFSCILLLIRALFDN